MASLPAGAAVGLTRGKSRAVPRGRAEGEKAFREYPALIVMGVEDLVGNPKWAEGQTKVRRQKMAEKKARSRFWDARWEKWVAGQRGKRETAKKNEKEWKRLSDAFFQGNGTQVKSHRNTSEKQKGA